MSILYYLQLGFSSLITISSVLLILSKNPIYSILFLILVFIGSSATCILFNIDFIGLLFIIIYVGAIAVLFLFVVMMLDLKIDLYTTKELNTIFLIICILCPLFFGLIYYSEIISLFNRPFICIPTFDIIIDPFFNIDIFGQSLYNYFSLCFLIGGLILLVAMLGAILLTLKYSGKRKNELFSRQLSRSDNFISFFS